jgi:hypothetical protein
MSLEEIPTRSSSCKFTRSMKKILLLLWSFLFTASPLAQAQLSCQGIFKAHDDLITPSWTVRKRTAEIDANYIRDLENNGAAVVTIGGSSVSMYFPEQNISAKLYFGESPRSAEQLASMIADAAEPALQGLIRRSKARTFHLIIPTPGLVQSNQFVTLPGNFGHLAGHVVDLKTFVEKELQKRLQNYINVYVENDALPVVAQAVYDHLKPGDEGTVLFGGTGTGVAKVSVEKNRKFNMLASEEGHLKINSFPGLIVELPHQLLIGASIASGVAETGDLTVENISAGGRIMPDGHPSHLSGANSATLSLLLDRGLAPQWVLDRLPSTDKRRAQDQWNSMQASVLKSFGFNSAKDFKAFLQRPENTADRELLTLLSTKNYINGEEIMAASLKKSRLALQLVHDNVYSQGIVAGVVTLNIGMTPSGTEITPQKLYGEPLNPRRQFRLLVRASEAFRGWENNFEVAQSGLRVGQKVVLSTPWYVQKLKAAGLALKPNSITITPTAMPPNPNVDFAGLNIFSNQLKSDDF